MGNGQNVFAKWEIVMDEIVLDADLKFLMTGLDMEKRGELLTALLNKSYQGNDDAINGVFCYILALQEKKEDKKKHMRELSALGVAARLKKLTEGKPKVNRRLIERKVTKESILNNKNNLNLFSLDEEQKQQNNKPVFVPPSVDEVRAYVEDNHLNVDADTFVNFYEAHGWMMGKVPICNWQATVNLWQKRAEDAKNKERFQNNKTDDENYWHELKRKVLLDENAALRNFPAVRQNLPAEQFESLDVDLNEKPFVRFMRRVEKYDINQESDDE